MAPTMTPSGRRASRIGTPTRLEVSSASASMTSPKSSLREWTERMRPRRTCCRIFDTVMARGLTTVSMPRLLISGP